MGLSIGSRLGPYEIVSLLGAGGMGEVYRARDNRLERDVAVKVLPSHLSSSPDFKARFDREAKAISCLQHSNICVLYDVGAHDGVEYLVMELLEGETIAQRLQRKPFSAEEAIKIGIEIADALDKAHRFGIVHRDLKPGNVMLTKSGAKLMDFGLAKRQSFVAPQSGAPAFSAAMTLSPGQSPITVAGAVVGTVQYMSPEQIEGKEADARSDIFAFGTLMYEMLTGKSAFAGKSQLSMASAILEKEPDPISASQPLTPPALEHTVRTCLAKDPEDRFQSAHDLKLQLVWISGSSAASLPVLKPKTGPWAKNSWALWAAGALAIFCVALLWTVERRTQAEPAVVRFTIPTPENAQVNIDLGPMLALSPDGQRLAFTVTGKDKVSRLYLRRMDQLEATLIPGTEEASAPFFSPDGQWVGFITVSRVKKVSVDGGVITELANVVSGSVGATWGPDGYIYYNRFWTERLSRVPQNGGKPEIFSWPDAQRHEQSHRWPEALPDGKSLLITIVKSFGAQDAEIAVLSLKTHTWKTVLSNAAQAHYSPTGHLLYVHAGTLMAVPFDLKSLTVTGPAVQRLHDVLSEPDSGYSALAVSDSGTLVFVKGSAESQQWPNTHLSWLSMDGKEIPASKTLRPYEDMSLSPDGKSVAFTIPGTPVWNIWTLDLERDTLNRLTFAGDNRDPLWAPDGKHIVYTSYRNGAFGLFWSTVDGSAPEQRLLRSDVEPFADTFTPDSKKLIFNVSQQDAETNTWEVPTTGDAVATPVKGISLNSSSDSLSPDGHWIEYQSSESGQDEIYVQPYPDLGGKWQISNGGGMPTQAQWSSDGKQIFYRNGDLMMAASVETKPHFSSSTARQLFTKSFLYSGRNFGVAGKRFFIMKQEAKQGATSLNVVLNWASELKK